jgi:hypothetical protein
MQVEQGFPGPAFSVSKVDYVLSGSGGPGKAMSPQRIPPNKLHLKIALTKTTLSFHNPDET